MRQAVRGRAGEAIDSRKAFQAAAKSDQHALIEFLKSLLQPKRWRTVVATAK